VCTVEWIGGAGGCANGGASDDIGTTSQ